MDLLQDRQHSVIYVLANIVIFHRDCGEGDKAGLQNVSC
jgi:hypothetical protein